MKNLLFFVTLFLIVTNTFNIRTNARYKTFNRSISFENEEDELDYIINHFDDEFINWVVIPNNILPLYSQLGRRTCLI